MNKSPTSFPNKKLRNQNSIFLIQQDKSLPYKGFNQKVSSYADYLKGLKLKSRNRVAILSGNSAAFVELIFAIWKLNAIPVPINTRLSKQEITELIKFIKPVLIFTDKKSRHNLNFDYQLIESISFGKRKSWEEEDLRFTFELNQTAVIIFTSGSTGKPKGVELTFKNLIKSAEIGNKVLNHRTKDVWLASLPFYHIGGFSIITRSYIYGTKLIIPKSSSVNDVIKDLSSYEITHVSVVSAHLKEIVDKKIRANKNLRIVLLGGGFTNSSIIDKAINLGWKIYRVYGSSEVASFAAIMKYNKNRKEATGKALPPNKIFINNVNKKAKPLESGEIIVKGPIVFKKYFNNQKGTRKKLKNNFLYTGDLGYLDKQGFLFVEARRSDLIVSGGENINPNEVEQAIIKYPEVSEVSVFPIKDEKWGQIAAAAISTKRNVKISDNELKTFLKKNLAVYKIPKRFLYMETLPRNTLGKIKKDKLIAMFNLST
jgi:O-succinylbenzoic acid--CoA ligase